MSEGFMSEAFCYLSSSYDIRGGSLVVYLIFKARSSASKQLHAMHAARTGCSLHSMAWHDGITKNQTK